MIVGAEGYGTVEIPDWDSEFDNHEMWDDGEDDSDEIFE